MKSIRLKITAGALSVCLLTVGGATMAGDNAGACLDIRSKIAEIEDTLPTLNLLDAAVALGEMLKLEHKLLDLGCTTQS
ncbi:MAG: hypothetical protein JWP38_1816 [Herbaspirillum sp.]|jgi:hypothetical protein|nr:hypothetical protein [Herbaspirillum sp.]